MSKVQRKIPINKLKKIEPRVTSKDTTDANNIPLKSPSKPSERVQPPAYSKLPRRPSTSSSMVISKSSPAVAKQNGTGATNVKLNKSNRKPVAKSRIAEELKKQKKLQASMQNVSQLKSSVNASTKLPSSKFPSSTTSKVNTLSRKLTASMAFETQSNLSTGTTRSMKVHNPPKNNRPNSSMSHSKSVSSLASRKPLRRPATAVTNNTNNVHNLKIQHAPTKQISSSRQHVPGSSLTTSKRTKTAAIDIKKLGGSNIALPNSKSFTATSQNHTKLSNTLSRPTSSVLMERKKSTSSIKSDQEYQNAKTPVRRRFTTRSESDLKPILSRNSSASSDMANHSAYDVKKFPFDMLQTEHIKLKAKFEKIKEERDSFERKYKSLQDDHTTLDKYCKSLQKELKSIEVKYNALVVKFNAHANSPASMEKQLKLNGLKTKNIPELSGRVYTSEKQTYILSELLTTEKEYVKTLRMIETHFYEPIRLEKLMSEQEQKQIFGNIQMVRQINELFLKDLEGILMPNSESSLSTEEKVYSWKQFENVIELISRVFVSFKLYCGYIGAYQSSIMQLNAILKKNTALKKFLRTTEMTLRNSKVRTSNLQSFLITPVQRPPRYRLLLEQLCKATDKGSNSHTELQKALLLICEICDYLNSRNAEIENSMKVLNIQEQFHLQGLIQPSRKYICESKHVCRISKNGKVSKTPGVMYIFNDLLLFTKTNAGLLGKKISEISLQPGVQLILDNDLTFTILGGSKQQTFQFGNGEKVINIMKQHEAFHSYIKNNST